MHESSRPDTGAHVALAVRPPGARGRAPGAALAARARALRRRLVPPRRLPRAGRDARGVDPPPPRGEGRRARALAPRAARDAERPGPQPARVAARDGVPRARAVATSTPPCRPTRAGTRSTTCRPWRSTTKGSRSPAATACARSSRTRTSASRSRRPTFTISELRDLYAAALGHDVSPTNLKRVLLRRGVLERTGTQRSPGPAGGRPAELYRFRSRELEITDQFAVLRPPPVT